MTFSEVLAKLKDPAFENQEVKKRATEIITLCVKNNVECNLFIERPLGNYCEVVFYRENKEDPTYDTSFSIIENGSCMYNKIINSEEEIFPITSSRQIDSILRGDETCLY